MHEVSRRFDDVVVVIAPSSTGDLVGEFVVGAAVGGFVGATGICIGGSIGIAVGGKVGGTVGRFVGIPVGESVSATLSAHGGMKSSLRFLNLFGEYFFDPMEYSSSLGRWLGVL